MTWEGYEMMTRARQLAVLLAAGALALLLLLPAPAMAQPVGLTLEVEKVLSGDTPPADEAFSFSLVSLDGGPLPDDPTLVIEGEGTGSFSIDFSRPGTFHYQLREIAGTAEGYTYDDTVYDVTVVVTSDGLGELSVAVVLSKDGGTAKEPKIVFENTYSNGGDPDEPVDPDEPDGPDDPGDPGLPEKPDGPGGSLPFSGDVALPIVLVAAVGVAALVVARRLRRRTK